TSYGSQQYEKNVSLVSLAFTSTNSKMGAADLNTVNVYLNGDRCSFRIIDTVAFGISVTEIGNACAEKIYPNPTFGEAFIEYHVSKKSTIAISLYDLLGNKVKDIYNGTIMPDNFVF